MVKQIDRRHGDATSIWAGGEKGKREEVGYRIVLRLKLLQQRALLSIMYAQIDRQIDRWIDRQRERERERKRERERESERE